MKKYFFLVLAAIVLLLSMGRYFWARSGKAAVSSSQILNRTWAGYKHYFIDADGRVMRPRENDTVSEGQAYAMLRAVWEGDKKTFDACYRWSEQNLSRHQEKGDHLLAWHWQDGKVTDWMPASDADIDYALSLVFASAQWADDQPPDLENYGTKAKKILDDILRLETFSSAKGRVYLAPWILTAETLGQGYPQNPSYYSPAHFRIFYQLTGNKKWMDLYETSYFLFEALLADFNGEEGAGFIPDWCAVDDNDEFSVLEGKSPGFGWESVRIPLRVAMDHFWFNAPEAKHLLSGKMKDFLETQWGQNNALFCEYNYDGTPHKNKYENVLFYASYYTVFEIGGSGAADDLLKKIRSYLQEDDVYWIYQDRGAYFENSLTWLVEAFASRRIIEYFKKGKPDVIQR